MIVLECCEDQAEGHLGSAQMARGSLRVIPLNSALYEQIVGAAHTSTRTLNKSLGAA